MGYKTWHLRTGHTLRADTETIHLLLNTQMEIWMYINVFTFMYFFFPSETEEMECNTEQKLMRSTNVRSGDV